MKILKWALMILGLLFLIDAIALLVISNFTTGNILVLLLGALLFVWGFKFETIKNLTKKGAGKMIRIAVTVALAAAAAFCAFFAIYGATDTVTYNEDAIIVLGCAVKGEVPSQPLSARLDKAIEYASRNPDAYIVVTGGQGVQEDISEAECMYRYLTERGVSGERIIKEDKATSTNENYRYSKILLDEKLGEYTTAVITNDFHIFRAKQLARLNGLEVTTMHADTPITSAAMMYLREILAVGKLILLKE